MKLIATIILLLISTAVWATNFGDEVVECAARSGVELDSKNLSNVFQACEKLVEQKREQAAREKEIKQMASAAWVKKCLTDASVQLDDGISTASDIARVVALKCNWAWNNFLESSDLGYAIETDGADEVLLDAALSTVIQSRTQK